MTPNYSLIFVLIIAAIKADQPPNAIQSIYVNATGCTLNYYSPPNNFSFVGCTTSSGDSNNWNTCVSRCCQDTKSIDTNTPSLLAIVECRNGVGSSGTSVAIIIMGVLVGVFSLIVILCFCVVTCRIVGNYQLRARIINNAEVVSEVEWTE